MNRFNSMSRLGISSMHDLTEKLMCVWRESKKSGAMSNIVDTQKCPHELEIPLARVGDGATRIRSFCAFFKSNFHLKTIPTFADIWFSYLVGALLWKTCSFWRLKQEMSTERFLWVLEILCWMRVRAFRALLIVSRPTTFWHKHDSLKIKQQKKPYPIKQHFHWRYHGQSPGNIVLQPKVMHVWCQSRKSSCGCCQCEPENHSLLAVQWHFVDEHFSDIGTSWRHYGLRSIQGEYMNVV